MRALSGMRAQGVERHYIHSSPLALHAKVLQQFANKITALLDDGAGKVIAAAARFGT
jgi:hypothetical protein